jgi:transposase
LLDRLSNHGGITVAEFVMPYRPHAAPTPGFFGYDPVQDLPQDHLARFVDCIVQESVHPPLKNNGRGQPQFDPRLLVKVLLYGYATGIRSSRQLERLCNESLPFLFLTRGDTPCYRTLCTFRIEQTQLIETAWEALFEVAGQAGLTRIGQITLDSSKIRADASPESVLKESEYADTKSELKRILAEAATVDAAEDNQAPGQTRLEHAVSTDQMRDILRRVRKQRSQARHSKDAPSNAPQQIEASSPTEDLSSVKALSPQMRKRIQAGIAAIEEAEKEARKHVSLTDPDARMMGEGREKRIHECHSFEVAVDNGLLVVGQSTNSGTDNSRLTCLVEAAEAQEPGGIRAVDADSGYYSGASVVKLIEAGIDVCLPDPNTSCDLHRDQPIGTTLTRITGTVTFDYNAEADAYTCPEGNTLAFRQSRTERGQDYRIYVAERSCEDCPLRSQCGRKERGKHRTLHVLVNKAIIEAHLARFREEAHKQRYRKRGPAVETVFGFMRSALGYLRWQLRGSERIRCEANLFKAAYQIRKVHLRCVSSLA